MALVRGCEFMFDYNTLSDFKPNKPKMHPVEAQNRALLDIEHSVCYRAKRATEGYFQGFPLEACAKCVCLSDGEIEKIFQILSSYGLLRDEDKSHPCLN